MPTSQPRPFVRPLLAAILLVAVAAPATAETIRVGRPTARGFAGIPLDIGEQVGIFKKHGLELDKYVFGGGRSSQAVAAGSVDVSLQSGPEMAFIAKGLPAKAIAASAGPPRELVLVVRTDLPDIKSAADLKGRTIGVTGPSLTGWLVTNMSNMQGWGPKGIKQNYAQPPASWALLKTKQIDGMVSDLGTALQAQREGLGRILLNFGDQLTDFHVHVILATDTAIREKPDMLRRFLAAWFETIAFMRAHKAETVAISKGIQDLDADLAAQVYDQAMPEFSADGRFDPKALAVLAQSYVDLDVLPSKPDMSTLYTEALLPAAH